MTAEASQAGPSAGPASDGSRPLRIALLTYKGNPFCGGQGVYVRHLSRELARLGHRVEVLGAQPYPVLDEIHHGPVLTELPSLDLYRQPDPSAPRSATSTATGSTPSRSAPCGPAASPSR
ncbi:hypothetical protein SALBM217S_03887 [Streptomyces griseoloalbus]